MKILQINTLNERISFKLNKFIIENVSRNSSSGHNGRSKLTSTLYRICPNVPSKDVGN